MKPEKTKIPIKNTPENHIRYVHPNTFEKNLSSILKYPQMSEWKKHGKWHKITMEKNSCSWGGDHAGERIGNIS